MGAVADRIAVTVGARLKLLLLHEIERHTWIPTASGWMVATVTAIRPGRLALSEEEYP